MEISSIETKIMDIMKEVLDEEKIANCDGNLLDVLDSIEFVTLIVEIETEVEIEIDDSDYDMEKLGDIHKLAELVEKYMTN